MGGHSYILLYLVTITNKKWPYYYVSCHRSNEWQVKLIVRRVNMFQDLIDFIEQASIEEVRKILKDNGVNFKSDLSKNS